jgi:SAM-dependent methyltransferase
VLDLSCGEGELLSLLSAKGCQGHGTHFCQQDYIVKNSARLADLAITPGVNLHEPIPLPDAAFDVVVLTEVLEHLQAPFCVIAEASRMLKPGGYLVFTTPNIFRLHSRFQFFLTGKHKLIRRRTGWDLSPEDLYAYHISPVDFPLLHTLLYQRGLKLQELRFTRFKLKSALFALLLPLVWMACRLSVDREAKTSTAFHAGERDLNGWLTHPALLFSEQLFGIAQKSLAA